MGGIITSLLTDANMRTNQAVENSLILHAKAGKAWASDAPGF